MVAKRFSPALTNFSAPHARCRAHFTLPAACLSIAFAAFSAAAQSQMPPKSSSSPPASAPVSAGGDIVHVMGFETVRHNAKGNLQFDSGQFSFTEAKGKVSIAASSIQLLSTGGENQEVGGVPLALGKMAVPYGGGRFLSLFTHKKIDTLALEYRDSGGGLHGALFRMPKGRAGAIAGQLIAAGAPVEQKRPVPGEPGYQPPKQSQAQPAAPQEGVSPRPKAAAISVGALQLDPVESEEFQIPLEFRVAIYERILSQVPTKKTAPPIYRAGDRRAAAANDLAVIHLSVTKFSKGSQTAREVTTVAGATKITVHLRLTDRSGNQLFAQEVSGNVYFFGENLRATLNLARRVADVLEQNVRAKT
jgi:hypothetical protein